LISFFKVSKRDQRPGRHNLGISADVLEETEYQSEEEEEQEQ
jgi:hypothetical protein